MANIGRRHLRPGRLGLALTLGIVATGAFVAGDAFAWKVPGHVYYAAEAMKDAKDGMIRIDAIDPATGKVAAKPLGSFKVNQEIFLAAKAYPEHYFAGVMGPDVFPDLIVGQQIIHPPGSAHESDNKLHANDKTWADVNWGGAGSDAWLQYLWDQVHTAGPNSTPPNKAFIAGWFAHAAGDLYAHTYVNTYTGGLFDLNQNAVRHIVLEGYLWNRTPHDLTWEGQPIFPMIAQKAGGWDDGVGPFMARTMNPATLPPYIHPGANRVRSVAYDFTQLRGGLVSTMAGYDNKLAQIDKRITAKMNDAKADERAAEKCSLWDLSCSATVSRARAAAHIVEAGALELEKKAFQAAHAPVDAYCDNWVDDIDDGLVAWPQTSQRVALAIASDAPKADDAIKALNDYINQHMLSMAGAPDFVGSLRAFVQSIQIEIPIVEQVQALIKDLKTKLLDYVFMRAFGHTWTEVKDYYTNPSNYLEKVFADAAKDGGKKITRADIDKQMGPFDAKGYFDWHNFPPAFNTVQMIKLTLVDPGEVDRLLREMGSNVKLVNHSRNGAPPNAILGYIDGMDASTQWANGSPFAKECKIYNRLFMRQPVPEKKNAKFEPEDKCGLSPAMLEFATFEHTVIPNQTVEILLKDTGGKPFTCQLIGAAKFGTVAPTARGCSFRAAPSIATRTEVGVVASWADGRPTRATVTLVPTLVPVVDDDTLEQGEKIELKAVGKEDVDWRIVRGLGTLGNPVTVRDLQGKLAAYDQAVAALGAREQQVAILAKTCSWQSTCTQLSAQHRDATRARLQYIAAHQAEHQRNHSLLQRELDTYYAPAKLTEDSVVRIEGATKDGRRTALQLRLDAPETPLAFIDHDLKVKAGSKTLLRLNVNIPIEWKLVQGAGGDRVGEDTGGAAAAEQRFGAALSTRMMHRSLRDMRVETRDKLPTRRAGIAAKPNKDDRRKEVQSTATSLAESWKRKHAELEQANAKVVKAMSAANAANEAREAMRKAHTYVAPAQVRAPTQVTVEAIAKDGSGRRAKMTFTVTP